VLVSAQFVGVILTVTKYLLYINMVKDQSYSCLFPEDLLFYVVFKCL